MIWTDESLAVHPDSRALIRDGLLPPPIDVSGGERETFAENEQLIEPGAGPEKWRGRGTAAAGATDVNTPAAASSAAAAGAQARRVEITFLGAAGRSRTTGPLPKTPNAGPTLVMARARGYTPRHDATRGSNGPPNRDCS